MSDKYWQKQKGLSLFIPRLEKNQTGHQKSIGIGVDSAPALDQYFFEARKNKGLCAGLRASWVAP
ncbi:MAG: hypothetical protein EOR84_12820 [Mesorhizobium sp.]|uniref:hypothetical protein n=1 Tax=Mesorhizobium sp. TaxID=1871066 RepID=UPI000FE639A4|nr:hypothetical protein [Mesorhizobium sp.]RWM97216.1 MAG: hypothetical protein EOR84_12820 [Mesorhizobium sp.]